MREEVFFVILTVIMIVGAMVVAVVVFLSDNDRLESEGLVSTQWHMELWNIYYGYKVDLRFVNTFVLGRISLYENMVGSVNIPVDNTISREHCMFYDQNDQLLIWNMSVINPASVNGARLSDPRQVIPGDRLEVGNSVFLVTVVEKN